MKTRTLACALLLGVCGAVHAQWNTLGGNTITLPTEYLGCDALSTQPLRLRNEADRPIEFFTGSTNVLRMRLSAAATSQTVNGFPGLDLSGYLGVGDFANVYPRAAAKVHVENAPSITVGYRPAMGDGFLSTQGEALFYSGLLGNGESGIIWSWATGPSGAPRPFRFIYTGDNPTDPSVRQAQQRAA